MMQIVSVTLNGLAPAASACLSHSGTVSSMNPIVAMKIKATTTEDTAVLTGLSPSSTYVYSVRCQCAANLSGFPFLTSKTLGPRSCSSSAIAMSERMA